MKRKPRGRKYGYDTLTLLIQVWNLTGRPSGKYLAATMSIWLPKLEEHHELDAKRLNDHTRAQLLTVSGATIDRLLKPTRDGAQLIGLSGTKPGPLLRNSIQVRKAGDEHERAPGFVEADLVLHCDKTHLKCSRNAARTRNPQRFSTARDPKILALPTSAWINKPIVPEPTQPKGPNDIALAA